MQRNLIKSAPSEAWAKKLPPIGFTIDRTGTAMTAKKFPGPKCYLVLSRFPQGSLEFSVHSYRNPNHNAVALKKIIRARFDRNIHHPFTMGKSTKVDLAGVERLAREFITGTRLKRKKWCAALVPSPNGGPFGLLVKFGMYIGSNGAPATKEMIKHPVFQRLISSFDFIQA